MFCLFLDPKFHWKESYALGEDRSCSAAQQGPAFSGQDCWSQRQLCTRGQPAHFTTILYQSKVHPSLRSVLQKSSKPLYKTWLLAAAESDNCASAFIPREKDGALQTGRTDPNSIERKAALKDCKHPVVLRVFTHCKTPFGA